MVEIESPPIEFSSFITGDNFLFSFFLKRLCPPILMFITSVYARRQRSLPRQMEDCSCFILCVSQPQMGNHILCLSFVFHSQQGKAQIRMSKTIILKRQSLHKPKATGFRRCWLIWCTKLKNKKNKIPSHPLFIIQSFHTCSQSQSCHLLLEWAETAVRKTFDRSKRHPTIS